MMIASSSSIAESVAIAVAKSQLCTAAEGPSENPALGQAHRQPRPRGCPHPQRHSDPPPRRNRVPPALQDHSTGTTPTHGGLLNLLEPRTPPLDSGCQDGGKPVAVPLTQLLTPGVRAGTRMTCQPAALIGVRTAQLS